MTSTIPQPSGTAGFGAAHRYRHLAIPAVTALVFGSLFLLWALGWPDNYFAFVRLFGIDHHIFPFLDSRAMLSWAECIRLGIDAFVVNPCGEAPIIPANYPPFWMVFTYTSLTRDGMAWLGWSFLGLFIVSLSLLPAPHGGKEVAVRLLASVSPTVAYALERANPETLIFGLAIAGCAWLLRAGPVWRWLGWVLFFLAGLIKLYPLSLLGIAVREGWRACLLIATAAAICAGVLWLAWSREMGFVLAGIPSGFPFGDEWGARNFAAGLKTLGPTWFERMPVLGPAITLALLSAAALCAGLLVRSTALCRAVWNMPSEIQLMAMAGSLLLSSSYVAASNANYRGIHLLAVFPAFFELSRGSAGKQLRNAGMVAVVVALFVLYSEFLRHALGMASANSLTGAQFSFWLVREAAWWVVFVSVTAFASAFATNALGTWPGLAWLRSAGARPSLSPRGRP